MRPTRFARIPSILGFVRLLWMRGGTGVWRSDRSGSDHREAHRRVGARRRLDRLFGLERLERAQRARALRQSGAPIAQHGLERPGAMAVADQRKA
ncbi:MAG: hypothetical protein ACREIR_09740, partial [Geminicoccaceae bacterium]